MSELQMLNGMPVLPDDPIERVKASLELTGDVEIKVPANQLAFVVHALYVGLSHPQFDYGDNVAAIEQLTDHWAEKLGAKVPGLQPLFEADREAILFSRKARKSELMPPLPGTLKGLKALAKKLGVKGYFAMQTEELVGAIEEFNPVLIEEVLSDG